MGSAFKTPKPPAPLDIAKTTAQANTQNTANAFQQTAFNRLDQTDALGNSLNYSQTGTDAQGNPTFGVNQSLGQTGQMYAGGLANLGQKYMSQAGQGVPDSQAAFDKAYGLATANLEPRFARAQDQAINRLRNQGLDPTSEAYKSSMNDLALQQNEARNQLVSSLQGQMFNQGLAGRQQSMNELNPGMQFANTALGGNYVNAPGVNVGNIDIGGLAAANQAGQWQNYNAQMQQKNAMLGGLAGIGGSLLMAPVSGGGSLGGLIGSKLF